MNSAASAEHSALAEKPTKEGTACSQNSEFFLKPASGSAEEKGHPHLQPHLQP